MRSRKAPSGIKIEVSIDEAIIALRRKDNGRKKDVITHGGDSLYNRMTTANLFREAQDEELDHKVKKVTEKISESMNIVANEPSLAFFRIQEHVRKSLPQLVEQKHEVLETQQLVQGASFDTEYANNTVKELHKSDTHFQNIQDLLKNAIFMKQQIDYQNDRR
ncbi:hypothetical protein FSP39_022839 [Pinctada imbricata]|uniref:Uncharacterized protein n=1 Tax=Pinctada imbricata TaxID=66713 RepID=A0AA89C804_PINIB|nr:hypothetical protein FSP39_022839 [Pinctada imbricata]